MDGQRSDDSAERFSTYLGELANVIGHAARVGPLRDYCSGLLLPRERKSVEPIAAATAPEQTSAQEAPPLRPVTNGANLSKSHRFEFPYSVALACSPDPIKHAAVLETVKARPGNDGMRALWRSDGRP